MALATEPEVEPMEDTVLTIAAEPNLPNCTIRVTSTLVGPVQLGLKVDRPGESYSDQGILDDAEPDLVTGLYEYVWVLDNLSSSVPINYRAVATHGAVNEEVAWTQPPTESGQLVEFPDVLDPHIAKVSEIISKITLRKYSTPEEWSELQRLVNLIVIRGNLVSLKS